MRPDCNRRSRHAGSGALDSPLKLKASVPGENILEVSFSEVPSGWLERVRGLADVAEVKAVDHVFRISSDNGPRTALAVMEAARDANLTIGSPSVQSTSLDDACSCITPGTSSATPCKATPSITWMSCTTESDGFSWVSDCIESGRSSSATCGGSGAARPIARDRFHRHAALGAARRARLRFRRPAEKSDHRRRRSGPWRAGRAPSQEMFKLPSPPTPVPSTRWPTAKWAARCATCAPERSTPSSISRPTIHAMCWPAMIRKPALIIDNTDQFVSISALEGSLDATLLGPLNQKGEVHGLPPSVTLSVVEVYPYVLRYIQ